MMLLRGKTLDYETLMFNMKIIKFYFRQNTCGVRCWEDGKQERQKYLLLSKSAVKSIAPTGTIFGN
jgi:hypothetical protein